MKKIFSLIISGILILSITGCGSKSNKLVKYLEDNNFKCENGTKDSDYGKTCTKSNSQKEEIFEISDDDAVIYTVKYGSYHYSISNSQYIKDSKAGTTGIVMSNDDDTTCIYLPDNGSFTYGGEYDTTSTKHICIRYIDKINNSLRDFENYFRNADVEL